MATDTMTQNTMPYCAGDKTRGRARAPADAARGAAKTCVAPNDTSMTKEKLPPMTVDDLHSKIKDYLRRQIVTVSSTEQPGCSTQDDVQMTPSPVSNIKPSERGERETILCPKCIYSCDVENEMIMHIFEHYDFTSLSALTRCSDFQYEAGQYTCVTCDLKTPSRLMFREHLRFHISPKPYSYTECGTAVSPKNINSHYKTLHPHSSPATHLASWEILDALMQQLGPAATCVDPAASPVAYTSVDVLRHSGKSASAHVSRDTSESSPIQLKQTDIPIRRRTAASLCSTEASKTVSSSSAQYVDLPLVPYTVDSITDNVEHAYARIQNTSDNAESGVHYMDLGMEDDENATPLHRTTVLSRGVTVPKSYAYVKPVNFYQNETGKLALFIKNMSVVDVPTSSSQSEQPKPVHDVAVKQFQQSTMKVTPVRKRTLKLLIDFTDGVFTCKTCNVKERIEAVFRKHIWRDIHPFGQCTHSTSADGHDSCFILDNILLLLRPKAQASVTPVNKKQTFTTKTVAGVPSSSGSQHKAKQKKAKGNQARIEIDRTSIERNTATAENKMTRAAALAARSKLRCMSKTQRSDEEDDDDDKFSPDNSSDDDWYGEPDESSLSEEEDDKITYTSSDSAISGPDYKRRNSAKTESRPSLRPAKYVPLQNNKCLLMSNTKHCPGSASADCRSDTEESTSSDVDVSLVPVIVEHGDVNDSVDAPELPCSLPESNVVENSASAECEAAFESDTSEPNDQRNNDAMSMLQESSEEHASERNDTIKGGSSKPMSEESMDCTLSERSNQKSSRTSAELQESTQVNEKCDTVNPLCDANPIISKQNDGNESTANTELSRSSGSAASVVGKEATMANEKPGVGGGDNETDSEEEEDGEFYKCKLPACGRSYADDASLKAHIKECHPSMTLLPCPYCSCLWSDLNRLVEHIPAHVGPTPYRCVQCDVCFKKNGQLSRHLKRSHHVNKMFTCTFSGCNYVSNMWTDFKVHNLSYHAKEKALTCFACDAHFNNLSDYFTHIESGMETLICCAYCSLKAKMRHTILRHTSSAHEGSSARVFVETYVKCVKPIEALLPKVLQVKRIVSGKKIYVHECSHCDFADENKASFDKHTKSHEHSEKLQLAFTCPFCPFGSSDLVQYKIHIANHRSKTEHELRCFKCIHCPFVTNEMVMVEMHLQEKHKERPFKYEVQQEIVTAKVRRPDVNHGVQQNGPTPSTLRKVQKSAKSVKATSPGRAVKEDVVTRKTLVTKTVRENIKRRQKSKCISGDDDDGDACFPVDKTKRSSSPKRNSSSERSVSLRRSCRIATKSTSTDHISSLCPSGKGGTDSYIDSIDDPIVPSSKPDNHNVSANASIEKTSSTASPGCKKSGSPQIDRFHCELCEFACSKWKLLHDHVQSGHANCTQWGNISLSVTSTADKVADVGDGASTRDDKKMTATDGDVSDTCSAQIERRYFCNLCGADYQEWDAFRKHMESAHRYAVIKPIDANQKIVAVPIERPLAPIHVCHSSGQFRCQNCTFSTDSKVNMWRHKKGHSAKLKAGFKCMYCNYSSPQKFVITRHVQNYHPDKPSDQPHVVALQSRKMPRICLKTATNSSMTADQRTEGVGRKTGGCSDMVQPMVQPEPILSAAPLNEAEFHSDNDDLPGDDDNGVGQTTADCTSFCSRVGSHDLFQCSLCEFTHRYPSKVLRHFNYRHTKHCPYQCGYCDFRSVESGKVKRHCGSAHRGQTPKVIKVDVDANTLEPVGVLMAKNKKDEDVETEDDDDDDDKHDGDNQWWWRRHVRTSDNQMMNCQLCRYRQFGISALKRHVLAIHLGFTPFACKYCDFSTTEIRKVREHIKKTHPGLTVKVIRRKYQSDSEKPAGPSVHGVKGGHSFNEAGHSDVVQSPLPRNGASFRVDISSAEGRSPDNTPPYVDTPIAHSARMTSATRPTLATVILNVKPERDAALDAALSAQHITFYKCIYCDFCSENSLHDTRDHIFVSHLRRKRFLCPHCQFGSMMRDDIIAHCRTDHANKNTSVAEDRTHARNISILETHGDVLLVGMLTDDKVPLVELPNIPQDAAPRLRVTSASVAPAVEHQKATNSAQYTNHSKRTARKSTSALSKTNTTMKLKGTLNAAVTSENHKEERVMFTCKVCNVSSKRMDSIEKHVLSTHLHMKLYGCIYCRKNISNRKLLQDHIMTEHPGKPKQVKSNIKLNRKVIRKFVVKKTVADDATEVTESLVPNRKRRGNASSHIGSPQQKAIRLKTRENATVTTHDDSGPDVYCSGGDGKVTALTCNDAAALVFCWKCKTCGTKLAKLKEMRYHVLTGHMNLQPYQCAVCDFGERTSHLVEEHIQDTHPHSRIHIPVVDVVQEKIARLKEMMTRVKTKKKTSPTNSTTGRFGESVYRCDLCDHKVSSKSKLTMHRLSHSEYRRYGCGYCSYEAHQLSFVYSHINSVHAGNQMKYINFKKAVAGSDVQTHTLVSQLNCETSVLRKSEQSGLSKKVPYRSFELEKNVRVTDYFQAAGKTPDADKAVSNRGVVAPSSEDNENTEHDQSRKFECLMCGKTMNTEQSVRNHIMNGHLKYMPYKCHHCTARNVNRHGVREHIAKHHPDKACIINFKCNKNLDMIVDANVKEKKDTNNTDDKDKHTPNNTGTKKVPQSNTHVNSSPQSSTGGTNSSTEKKIMSTESYLCVLCKTYTATWKHDMLRHIAEEIHYSPFVCPHCPFRTNRQDAVRNHAKSEHPRLKVSVKFNKDVAKEQRALELLEMSVVIPDNPVTGIKVRRNRGDSPGSSCGDKRAQSLVELGTELPIRKKVRRPGLRTPGRAMYWHGDEFQPSVPLVDVMKMTYWELKHLLVRLHLTSVSILF